ncbi:hypothetical protein LPTSP4_10800 [Leptospira ryugenii]|uniref:Uncharacterized protein n=1 Tax=Leptospira ryugenii TaxID=1917863 RepID=A0A2P2DY57_9LEPT|nr:hypothetical protein [Leptospira ryugenii]GBF49565.1 hypothetical protein LPTSP4_10800 [Leptospira ryugenii]
MRAWYLSILILAISLPLLAQEATNATAGKENTEEIEKLDQGTNLERKQYKDISERYKDRIANGIKLLTIISSNFGEDVPDAKAGLENIRKEYQNALRFYYRHAYIASGKAIQKVDKDVNGLLGKFAKVYDTKTQALLVECADAITSVEQSQIMAESQDSANKSFPNTYIDVSESTHKLKIAYYQLSLALSMAREDRYYESIVHYRIAKDFGIKILSDLKEAEADKKAITDKYSKDLSDNKNQIFSNPQATGK